MVVKAAGVGRRAAVPQQRADVTFGLERSPVEFDVAVFPSPTWQCASTSPAGIQPPSKTVSASPVRRANAAVDDPQLDRRLRRAGPLHVQAHGVTGPDGVDPLHPAPPHLAIATTSAWELGAWTGRSRPGCARRDLWASVSDVGASCSPAALGIPGTLNGLLTGGVGPRVPFYSSCRICSAPLLFRVADFCALCPVAHAPSMDDIILRASEEALIQLVDPDNDA